MIVGRTSVWSVHTLSTRPRGRTPGPTYPTHVLAISSWIDPWFHAKLDGPRGGMKAQASGVAQAVLPDAKKNQFGSANAVNVDCLAGSAVIMCSASISV